MNLNMTSYDLSKLRSLLDLFDGEGIQVDGKVFVEDVGEATVEYDALEDRHYITAFTRDGSG